MKILGIETSCDETAASVVEVAPDNSYVTLLSTVTATSLNLHAKTGGIIPEIAARNQIKDIIPVIYEALEKAQVLTAPSDATIPKIDAIAVTYGPGLIGSLLVGVETAKTLSYIWEKPLIPVNHLFGHIYAAWIQVPDSFQNSSLHRITYSSQRLSNTEPTITLPQFPAIGLIISGGHTDLILMKNHAETVWLGGTRDDAAGEAFDKIGRMINFPYPAGPAIEAAAKNGDPKRFHFPRPLMYDKHFDFSFSGLKTAVLREVEKLKNESSTDQYDRSQGITLDTQTIADISRGVQDAISDVIIYKTVLATEKYGAKSIIIGGGVAANQTLKNSLQQALDTKSLLSHVELFSPQKFLCTDNASMIACAAAFIGEKSAWKDLIANPELYFD